MYKHEMPDLAKLKELGFRETPKWWRDRASQSSHIRRPPTIKRTGMSNPHTATATNQTLIKSEGNLSSNPGTMGQDTGTSHEVPVQLPTSSIRRRVLEESKRISTTSRSQTCPHSKVQQLDNTQPLCNSNNYPSSATNRKPPTPIMALNVFGRDQTPAAMGLVSDSSDVTEEALELPGLGATAETIGEEAGN
jgi:hypothetical protein